MATTTVELPGGEHRTVAPHVADAEEKRELWPLVVATYRGYDEYAGYTARDIPIIVLAPA
jgi:hypothetical protein